jgi:predicted nucleic acid-binding Zn ribbon protein
VTRVRRSPRSLEFALEGIRHDVAPESLLGDVQSVWSRAVGPVIAEQALPVSERGGVLTVSCAASVWAQELDLMGPVIIERLNNELRGERITRLRCVSTPPPDA